MQDVRWAGFAVSRESCTSQLRNAEAHRAWRYISSLSVARDLSPEELGAPNDDFRRTSAQTELQKTL